MTHDTEPPSDDRDTDPDGVTLVAVAPPMSARTVAWLQDGNAEHLVQCYQTEVER